MPPSRSRISRPRQAAIRRTVTLLFGDVKVKTGLLRIDSPAERKKCQVGRIPTVHRERLSKPAQRRILPFMRHPMLCLLAVAACGGQAPAPASSAVPTAPLVIGKRTAPRACVPAARVYVTLTPLTNKTGRPTAELDAIVRSAIVRKLEAAPEVVLSKESHVAGRCELVLGPGVRAFEYGGGNLRVSFDLSVRRPDGTLIGGAPKSLSKEGVGNADHASEDQVLTRAAELAAEDLIARAKGVTQSAMSLALLTHASPYRDEDGATSFDDVALDTAEPGCP